VGTSFLNNDALDGLVKGLSDEDQGFVRGYIEGRHKKLCEIYEWTLAHTLVFRQPHKCPSVVAKVKKHGVDAVWEGDDSSLICQFIDPSCTQCVWMHPVDGGGKKRSAQADYLQLISDDTVLDDTVADIDHTLLQWTIGRDADHTNRIELVPLFLEIFGEELAVGQEALELMSPDGLVHWLFMYLTGPIYAPHLIQDGVDKGQADCQFLRPKEAA
jgi:hypothetical protein